MNLELQQPWLDAHKDTRAAIYTFSSCITLADLSADGDFKLVVADLGTGSTNVKLKVYRGISLHSEIALMDIPTGVLSFYMDNCEPKVPAVAVASGSNVYIYKNMRPYFKFSLPPLEVNSVEKELWMQSTLLCGPLFPINPPEFSDRKLCKPIVEVQGSKVRDEDKEIPVLIEMLQSLRNEIGHSQLSPQSQKLFSLDAAQAPTFVNKHKNFPIKRQTIVTCVTTLKKTVSEEKAVSCLVVGTENGDVYVLDPEAFTILNWVKMSGVQCRNPSAPVHVAACGLHAVEFRIVAVCRDGCLRLARRGWTEGKVIAQLSSHPVALMISPDSAAITLAMMDETLQCYSKKGKKQWEVRLPAAPTTLTPVPLPHQSTTLVAVALNGGLLHFYHGRQLVDTLRAQQSVSGMVFGRFGQEENALIMFTVGESQVDPESGSISFADGSLIVKILKRTAHFNLQEDGSVASQGALGAAQVKLQVPKKTRVFLDQAVYERENCLAMHRTFQRDLFQLRLDAARACVQAINSCSNPIGGDRSEPLKLSVQVLGLGPVFKLHISLQNMSASRPIYGLFVLLHSDDKVYSVDSPFQPVPFMVPSIEYKFEAVVKCLLDFGISDQIKVLVVRHGRVQPVLAAVINMPISDSMGIV